MKSLLIGLGILLGVTMVCAQTFHDFINRLYSLPGAERGAVIDSFMNAAGAFPYIERDTLAHFIYRGTASSVTVPGDANGWNPAAFPMQNVSATNFWYYSRIFEADARLDYKYVLNGSNWILDPLNPHRINGGFGPNSELRMPDWVFPPEVLYYTDIPHGSLLDTVFFSSSLGNSRTIRVYTPPAYSGGSEHYPVVVLHDGLEYISLAQADNVLDYLIHHRRIEPVIAVFVPPVNRSAEYAGNLQNAFTTFIVSELLVWLEQRFRTRNEPSQRATLGASNGGNIALWLAYSHPDVFGNVAAQSSNVQSSISSGLENGPQLNLRFYLDLGTYDIAVLIPLVRNLRQILDDRGYEYRYVEYHEGHSWGNWRAHVDNALEMFFPGDSITASPPRTPRPDFHLLKTYPNPFNAATTIVFTLPSAQHVSLHVYDVLGRHVAAFADSILPPGTHQFEWRTPDLAAGVYFCALRTDDRFTTRKMLLLK